MGEQLNFKPKEETRKQFVEFCKQNGYTQPQGFDHVMQVLSLQEAKFKVPNRQTEIENFERLTKELQDAYITSLEMGTNAVNLAKEDFKGELEHSKTMIDQLQETIMELRKEKTRLCKENEEMNREIQRLYDDNDDLKQEVVILQTWKEELTRITEEVRTLKKEKSEE